MATRRKAEEPPPRATKRRPPATTPEARERQITAKAIDLIEEQIEKGVASSQLLTHYAKLASQEHELQMEKLRSENELLKAKVKQIESEKNVESLLEDALTAFTSYRPPSPENPFD